MTIVEKFHMVERMLTLAIQVEDKDPLILMSNTMVASGLTPQGADALASMVLTLFTRNIPFSAAEGSRHTQN